MAMLVCGLALFFIVHLVPMRPALRAGLVERVGAGPYRGLFSVVSIAGLVLIVLGYGQMQGLGRGNPELWTPPTWIKHVVLLLMIPAMILLVAAYVPSRIRSAVASPDAGGLGDLGIRAPAGQRRPGLAIAVWIVLGLCGASTACPSRRAPRPARSAAPKGVPCTTWPS